MFVFVDGVAFGQHGCGIGPAQAVEIEEGGGALGDFGQHGREVDGEDFEGVDQLAAYFVQCTIQ